MQKFFIDSSPPASGEFLLTGDNFDHIKVLRLRVGDTIVLCDGSKTDFFCRITELSRENAVLICESALPSVSEPTIDCGLFVAMPKADKLEHIIQKAVELGATSVTTFVSSRCVSRPDAKSMAKKLQRWQKIAESAASQCGRGIIPQVTFADSYGSALAQASRYDAPLLLYENESKTSLKAALSQNSFSSVSILSGPEGGFSEDEVQQASSAGLISCSLGPRILRCETAPLCALSAVMYHSDNM